MVTLPSPTYDLSTIKIDVKHQIITEMEEQRKISFCIPILEKMRVYIDKILFVQYVQFVGSDSKVDRSVRSSLLPIS